MNKSQEHHNIIRTSRNHQRGYRSNESTKITIKEIIKDKNLDLIQLRNKTSSVIICPEKGGTCISLELGGNRLLYNDPNLRNNRDTASRESHYMGPHAGPLNPDIQKRLGFNSPRHGFIRNVSRKIGEISDDSIHLIHESDSSTLEQFPYPVKLEQIITLGEYKTTFTLKITNIGDTIMPFAPGHHTYYRIPVEHQSQIKFEGINISPDQLKKICSGKEVVKVKNPGKITMKSSNTQPIIMTYSDQYKRLWLRSEDKKGHFCVEPVTCHGDDFETQALQIKPGATETITFSIELDISN